jgi:UDP-N-acetylmuramyl pentapeptide synthase
MTAAAPPEACGLRTFPDAAAAAAALAPLLRPGAWVLLKGSRGMRLETLLPPGAAAPAGH